MRRLKRREGVNRSILGKVRPKKRSGANWLRAAVVILILISGILVFRQIFIIRRVDITFDGYACDNQQVVESLLGLQGKVILWLSESNIEQKIRSNFFCVRSIELNKYFPDRVAVLVHGRYPVAVAVKGEGLSGLLDLTQIEATAASSAATVDYSIPQPVGSKYLMDEEGILFYSTEGDVNLPTLYIGSDLSLKQNFGREIGIGIKNLFETLTKIGITPKVVKLTNSKTTVVIGQDGEKLVLNLKNALLKQLASLQLIWQKNKIDSKRIESIDLRFDKPVVIYSK